MILDPKDATACQQDEDEKGHLQDRYQSAYNAAFDEIQAGDDAWLWHFKEADFHELVISTLTVVYSQDTDYDHIERFEDIRDMYTSLISRYCDDMAQREIEREPSQ